MPICVIFHMLGLLCFSLTGLIIYVFSFDFSSISLLFYTKISMLIKKSEKEGKSHKLKCQMNFPEAALLDDFTM